MDLPSDEEKKRERQQRLYKVVFKYWVMMLADYKSGIIRTDNDLFAVVTSLNVTVQNLIRKVYGEEYLEEMITKLYLPDMNLIRETEQEKDSLEQQWNLPFPEKGKENA